MTQRQAALAAALLAVAGCAAARGANTAPTLDTRPAGRPVRTLWAGSSSLYYHNMPNLLARWLTRAAGAGTVTADLVGKSGTGVHVYLRPDFRAEFGLKPGETVLDKVRDGRYDYLVLQCVAEFIAGPEGDEFDRALDEYARAVRAAGGEPVFYEMGWGSGPGHEAGLKRIEAAAVRNRVALFAPCATAWMRARAERPDLDLQDPPDKTHPGTLGCYLNLCCLWAAFTGTPPVDPPRELRLWRHLSDAEKAERRAEVPGAAFDAYEAALPGWMKMHTVAARPVPIDPAQAAWLQKVAWETCQAAQGRLRPR